MWLCLRPLWIWECHLTLCPPFLSFLSSTRTRLEPCHVCFLVVAWCLVRISKHMRTMHSSDCCLYYSRLLSILGGNCWKHICIISPQRNQDDNLRGELRSDSIWQSLYPWCRDHVLETRTQCSTPSRNGLLRLWRQLYCLGWYEMFYMNDLASVNIFVRLICILS